MLIGDFATELVVAEIACVPMYKCAFLSSHVPLLVVIPPDPFRRNQARGLNDIKITISFECFNAYLCVGGKINSHDSLSITCAQITVNMTLPENT